MASISTDKRGNRTVQFMGCDRKRRSVRLGPCSLRIAEKWQGHIERLAIAKKLNHSVERETANWVADLEDPMHEKLAAVGLVEPRAPKIKIGLGAYLDEFVAKRIDVKPATIEVWGQIVRNLKGHFGEGRDPATITEADADDFKLYLIGEKLSPTTVSKRLQFARMFFKSMLKRKLIVVNPFAEVSARAVMRTDRQRYVTPEETKLIMDVCNPEWKVIVALARYGGLRTPSEPLSLRWQDINWDTLRIVVTSPKTEHHEGKGSRVIPLFPELLKPLREAYEAAEPGAEFVLPRQRAASLGSRGWRNCNLRTQFERLVKRAGLAPWPRLFHALRSSRETELAKEYPIHVVTSWLGNTPRIAMKHYLMTTDSDFERAAKSGAVSSRTEPHQQETPANPDDESSRFAGACGTMRDSAIPSCGEDRKRTSAKFAEICAEFAASAANSGAVLDGLATVVEAWPNLPAELRRDILGLVESAVAGEWVS
ncbi:MAG TPA: tyrosine-type recombinase/integrase [Pirellulaceae bacterium]|nr:tyrosine-type recombinase/integrase [Pirellulaceae bacterium]